MHKYHDYQVEYRKTHKELISRNSKLYRLRHPDRIKVHRKRWKIHYTQKLAQFKNKPCKDCWGWFEPCQMEFDHRDPNTKSFEIGNRRYSSAIRLAKEIAKCDLVCSNCHRLRTWKRATGKL